MVRTNHILSSSYLASRVSLIFLDQLERGRDSASGFDILSSAAYPRKWMSQSSFELVRLVFVVAHDQSFKLLTLSVPTIPCLLVNEDKHGDRFAFAQSVRKSSEFCSL